MDTGTIIISGSELIDQYFNIYPTGISLKNPQEVPPIEAFDVLGYSLAGKADELRWQAASFCNLYKKYYPNIYEEKAQHFFVRPQTIEVWAYVERNVPPENRTNEKTIYHHRVVAKIDDKQQQANYMQHCVDNNLSVRGLEKWVAQQRNEPAPPSYEDRQFKRMQAEYKDLDRLTRINTALVLKIQELENTIKELEQAAAIEPPAIAPADLPGYATRALGDIENALLEFSYSSVTVYQNGDVRWHK